MSSFQGIILLADLAFQWVFFSLTKYTKWKMRLPCFCQLLLKPLPPQRKTNLHGQINSNGSQTTLLKYLPTEQIAWHIFHFHIHLEENVCCTSDKLKGNYLSNAETLEVNSITSGFDMPLEMFWTPGLSFFISPGARHWEGIHSTE